ncbi:hypothetical protein GQR58_003385 [Nymphon striatum]|nr:hypothetical protein GQR58_003385 [Nymphon striatum]
MSKRAYYSSNIPSFVKQSPKEILGDIQDMHSQDIVQLQTNAWKGQIEILQQELSALTNGTDKYHAQDLRQVHDYALDLSYFHEGSHNQVTIPVLVATEAEEVSIELLKSKDMKHNPALDYKKWIESSYKPTPTIIEAAQALYADHEVEDISRNDAGAMNLNITSNKIKEIIHYSNINNRRSICFVTGVPGAGKTLVGLNIATSNANPIDDEYSVFLSGNGPLVEVLREALVRDEVSRKESKTKSEAKSKVHPFIQNVHHFRDGALNEINPPLEKVAIFDEAQRAWDKHYTSKFMRQKRGQADFNQSEPEFLIEVMNRHKKWCVIVALIGGGQEINNGEAGLTGWFDALSEGYDDWDVYYSDKLNQREYAGGYTLELEKSQRYMQEPSLHLGTSMRSFKAERLSHMVHHMIHNNAIEAYEQYQKFKNNFSVKITRNLQQAKNWVREQARGNETKGVIASSGAIRLKPEGLFVKNKLSASNYFLNDQEDIRSCHFLEDVATEFDIQGLELDWCCVCWDSDYRYVEGQFEHWEFRGTKWNRRKKEEKRRYLENSYRVLLTRARQGMVIFIPDGDKNDHTRKPEFYNQTYEYLINCGVEPLEN